MHSGTRRPRRGPRPSGPHRGEHTLPRRLALRRRAGRRESPVSASRPALVRRRVSRGVRTNRRPRVPLRVRRRLRRRERRLPSRHAHRSVRPELNSTVGGGFGSSPSGRFDIVWTERDCDNFHDTEPDGVDVRFDPIQNRTPRRSIFTNHLMRIHGFPVYRSRTGRRRRQSGGDRRLRRVSRSAWVRGDGQSSKKWVSDTEVIGFEKRLTPQQPIGFDLLVNGLGCRQTEAQ